MPNSNWLLKKDTASSGRSQRSIPHILSGIFPGLRQIMNENNNNDIINNSSPAITISTSTTTNINTNNTTTASATTNIQSPSNYDDFNRQPRTSDVFSEARTDFIHLYDTNNLSNYEINKNNKKESLTHNKFPGSKNTYYRNIFINDNSSLHRIGNVCCRQFNPTNHSIYTILVPSIIFLIGILLGLVTYFVLVRNQKQSFDDTISYNCDERTKAIINGFVNSLDITRDFLAFFTVATNINITTINQNDMRLLWEKDNGPIRELNANGEFVYRGNASEYFPIQYSYPIPRATYYDVFSESKRASSITKARETKNMTLTNKLPLASNTSIGGIFVFFPFYANAVSKDNPPDSDVDGVIFGIYDIDKNFASILNQLSEDGVALRILDHDDDDSVLFDSRLQSNQTIYRAQPPVISEHKVLDRDWKFECLLTSKYFKKYLYTRDMANIQTQKLGRTQSLLKAMTADSKAVLEAIADPLVALNSKGEIVGANKHALKLTGYSPDDIKVENKMHISHLLLPHPDTPPIFDDNNNGIGLTRDSNQSEVAVKPGMKDVFARRKDGTTFESEANFSQPVVEKNYFTQVVMFRDVTFKKENERAVIEAKNEADLANQSKTEFLFFLCHEIRNPAHAILGFVDMLQKSLKNQYEELDYITAAGRFLNFIVNDVLDLTHLTNPSPYEIELKSEEMDPYLLIQNIAKIQSIEASSKRINLKTIIHSDLPKKLYSDPHRLEQVLNKLLARSIEVSPEGSVIELELQVLKQSKSKGVLTRVSVKDHSKGFRTDEEISELFKPYSKTNSSIGSRFHAQGLSMALAQAIIKVMGGRLTVDKITKSTQHASRVWFDIWILTEDAKYSIRESFDTNISRNESSGGGDGLGYVLFNSKFGSAPSSTDGRNLNYVLEVDTIDSDNKSQLRSSKSMSIAMPKRSHKSYKNAPHKINSKRSKMTTSGEESEDDVRSSIMLAVLGNKSSKDANKSIIKDNNSNNNKLKDAVNNNSNNALGSGGSSSTIITINNNNDNNNNLHLPITNDDIIHNHIQTNNEISVTTTNSLIENANINSSSLSPGLPPIVTYYSGDNNGQEELVLNNNDSINDDLQEDYHSSPQEQSMYLPIISSSPPSSKITSTHNNDSDNTILLKHHSTTSSFDIVNADDNKSSNNVNSPRSPSNHPLHITLPNTISITNKGNSPSSNAPHTPPPSSHAPRPPSSLKQSSHHSLQPAASSSHEKPLNVLLVEDNLVCQRVTSKMLLRNNFTVELANHGKEAVEMVDNGDKFWNDDGNNDNKVIYNADDIGYCCILMDIITPVMNGYEATKLLRDNGIDIPILALTANSFGSDVKKSTEVGMDAFLTKPINETQLINAINKEIENYKNNKLQHQLKKAVEDEDEIYIEQSPQSLHSLRSS
nr:4965_t:CDS:2 [Entrophospora candida]